MSSPTDTRTETSTDIEIVADAQPDTVPDTVTDTVADTALETSPETAPDTAPDEMDDTPPPATVKKWTVRGVPVDVRDRAVLAAKESGKTIGELVAEALTAHLDTFHNGRTVESDPFEEMDAMARYFEDRIITLEKRLTVYEADQRKVRQVQRPWIRSVS